MIVVRSSRDYSPCHVHHGFHGYTLHETVADKAPRRSIDLTPSRVAWRTLLLIFPRASVRVLRLEGSTTPTHNSTWSRDPWCIPLTRQTPILSWCRFKRYGATQAVLLNCALLRTYPSTKAKGIQQNLGTLAFGPRPRFVPRPYLPRSAWLDCLLPCFPIYSTPTPALALTPAIAQYLTLPTYTPGCQRSSQPAFPDQGRPRRALCQARLHFTRAASPSIPYCSTHDHYLLDLGQTLLPTYLPTSGVFATYHKSLQSVA